MLVLGSSGLGRLQRNQLPLFGLGSISNYCGAPFTAHIHEHKACYTLQPAAAQLFLHKCSLSEVWRCPQRAVCCGSKAGSCM